ncbi:MAG: hypothetical protein AAFR61_25190 [Bacteroidota bacterium]
MKEAILDFPNHNSRYYTNTIILISVAALLGLSNIPWWVCAIIGLAGLAFLFAFNGIKIDTQNRRFKTYVSYLGIRMGRWESLDQYPDMVVLRRKQKAKGAQSMLIGDPQDMDHSEALATITYEVQLASRNHINRIGIYSESSAHKEKVYAKAREIAQKSGIELVRFNPGMRYPRKVL